MKTTMTVASLKEKLAAMPDDMPVLLRVAMAEGEEISFEEGDDVMGDLRDAYVEHGCGSAPPACILDGDRDPSEMIEDE